MFNKFFMFAPIPGSKVTVRTFETINIKIQECILDCTFALQTYILDTSAPI
jgi:hypothetical protein